MWHSYPSFLGFMLELMVTPLCRMQIPTILFKFLYNVFAFHYTLPIVYTYIIHINTHFVNKIIHINTHFPPVSRGNLWHPHSRSAFLNYICYCLCLSAFHYAYQHMQRYRGRGGKISTPLFLQNRAPS